jgi:branched-chain amino acid transport system substrate-binding protein
LSYSKFDADRQLADLISEGAEAILLSPHVDRLDRAIALAKANQWRLVLLGTLTFDTPVITESGQGDINGIVIPLPFHHDLASARSFSTAASQQWGIDVNWRTATAYDATRAILTGLSKGLNCSSNS